MKNIHPSIEATKNTSQLIFIRKPPKEHHNNNNTHINDNHSQAITTLSKYITDIINKDNISDISYEKVYKTCYKLIISGKGMLVQQELTKLLQEVITSKWENQYHVLNNCDSILQHICLLNEQFQPKITLITKFLVYYEKNHLFKLYKTTIYKQYLNSFYESIIIPNQLLIQNEILNTISNIRNNNKNDSICKTFISFIRSIKDNYYELILKHKHIETTKEYFHIKSNEINTMKDEPSLQITTVYNYIKLEREISSLLKLNSIHKNEYLNLINTHLISKIDLFIHTSSSSSSNIIQVVNNCIQNNNSILLHQIGNLFTFMNSIDIFVSLFTQSIEQHGKQIVSDFIQQKQKNKEHIITFINTIADLLITINTFIAEFTSSYPTKNVFESNNKLYNAISSFINVTTVNNKSILAIHLSQYIHICFKDKMPISFDNITHIFKYIRDKDVFEYSYRKYFGMRLLNGLALINESTELEILKAFKKQCGAIYINKCETMYNDIQKSRKFIFEHLDSINNSSNTSSLVTNTMNYSINILTFSIWDIKRFDTIEHSLLFNNSNLFHYEFYTFDIYNYINEYIMFYKKFNLNTVIYHSLYHGTVELYVCYLNGNKVSLSLSPIQAFICLMFHKNKSRVVMVNDIMKCFHISDKERVNDVVVPMINKGIVMYNEMKNGIKFGLDDNVWKGKKINTKVNIDRYKDKEMLEEGVVYAQRKIIVDSYIMKIMKAKQKCSHNMLVAELVSALNNQFVPDAVMLKNRIEGLIEREYLEREGNTYIYKR